MHCCSGSGYDQKRSGEGSITLVALVLLQAVTTAAKRLSTRFGAGIPISGLTLNYAGAQRTNARLVVLCALLLAVLAVAAFVTVGAHDSPGLQLIGAVITIGASVWMLRTTLRKSERSTQIICRPVARWRLGFYIVHAFNDGALLMRNAHTGEVCLVTANLRPLDPLQAERDFAEGSRCFCGASLTGAITPYPATDLQRVRIRAWAQTKSADEVAVVIEGAERNLGTRRLERNQPLLLHLIGGRFLSPGHPLRELRQTRVHGVNYRRDVVTRGAAQNQTSSGHTGQCVNTHNRTGIYPT